MSTDAKHDVIVGEEEGTLDFRRKSVIRSVLDANLEGQMSFVEDASYGSSIMSDGHSNDTDDSILQRHFTQADKQPSVDPSEIECVLTDTSGDDSSDDENSPLDIGNKPSNGQRSFSCFMCPYDEKGSNEFVKHLLSSHKFAIRKVQLSYQITESESKADSYFIEEANRNFNCEKNCGCNELVPSKQTLANQHTPCKSASWFASQRTGEWEDNPSVFCNMCPYETSSRRRMLNHMETYHNCLRNVDKALNTFSLSCRVCKARFWTVTERCKHEVSEHTSANTNLFLKCHVCLAKFSSKVCLKKHLRVNHTDGEQFSGGLGFRCCLCSVTYPSFILVQEHFHLSHKSHLVFQCEKCGLVLKTLQTYHAHLKSTVCGSVHQECSLCKKVFWSRRALSIHLRMKHLNSSNVEYLCQICKQHFSSKLERTQHYAAIHKGNSPFKCPICGKGFSSKSGMYGHRQTHSKTSMFKCHVCGKEFIRKDSFYEHLLIHNGPRHKCSYCDKEFVQRSNLVRHLRIHTGEKPYKCLHCDKTFSDKGACNAHIRVHTRADACSCPYCGQVFSKKQKLKYHLRKHTGENLVSCEICGKTFTNSHSLKEHRVIHDHSTQMLCTHCGKAFSSAKYLHRHIAMSHDTVLSYTCPVCFRGFPQKARLKSHLMTHSPVKHLRCLLCSKAYSVQKSLRRHLLTSHNITSSHPDFKQSFYAMTIEETGVGEVPSMRKPTSSRLNGGDSCEVNTHSKKILRPKSEPLSSESDSEETRLIVEESNEDSSEHVFQEPVNTSKSTPSLLPIKTKAARKELPFCVVSVAKKAVKSFKVGHCLIHSKQKQVSNEVNHPKRTSLRSKLLRPCSLRRTCTCIKSMSDAENHESSVLTPR